MLCVPRFSRLVLSACLLMMGMNLRAVAESTLYEGVQASGSLYRITVPPAAQYNRVLVIYAHGFQEATDVVRIPEEQLGFGEVYLPDLVNALGFGFATNSYSKPGLAVLHGVDDILDLVTIYEQTVGRPEKIYLAGISEGGLVVTLLLEQHPELFAGGLSACGLIGDFRAEINYIGDARATFEYYFPGLIVGDPLHPSPELVATWSMPGGYYESVVEPALIDPNNAAAFQEWARVAQLPFDPNDREATLLSSARFVLSYVVVNLNDAAATLGGFPFENRFTWYTGASDPWGLNSAAIRTTADPVALEEMRLHYTPTGKLTRPLMTLHTLYDPLVPYWHETVYTLKNLRLESYLTQRVNLPVERYGHCNFELPEVLSMFALLLAYNDDLHLLLPGLERQRQRDPVRLTIPLADDREISVALRVPGSNVIEKSFVRAASQKRKPRVKWAVGQ